MDEQEEYEKALEEVKKALNFLEKQEGVVYIFSSLLVPKTYYVGTEKKLIAYAHAQGRGDSEWTRRLLQGLVERLFMEGSKNTKH